MSREDYHAALIHIHNLKRRKKLHCCSSFQLNQSDNEEEKPQRRPFHGNKQTTLKYI